MAIPRGVCVQPVWSEQDVAVLGSWGWAAAACTLRSRTADSPAGPAVQRTSRSSRRASRTQGHARSTRSVWHGLLAHRHKRQPWKGTVTGERVSRAGCAGRQVRARRNPASFIGKLLPPRKTVHNSMECCSNSQAVAEGERESHPG